MCNSLPIPGGSGRCTTARTTRPAARGRGREGGMLGGAGGCVAVLIFTLTYHLGGTWCMGTCCVVVVVLRE